MRLIRLSVFCLFWWIVISQTAFAQVTAAPSLMNFQGRLAKPDGTPIADGSVNLQFALFNAPTGGTLLWQRSVTNIPVRNGTFATRFDFSSGFQNGATLASVFGASAVYLEMSINGASPLTPRQQFLTVAYAFKANSVQDRSITGASIAAGTITNVNIAAGTVTGANIAPGTITGTNLAAGTITADKIASDAFNPLVWLMNGNSGVTSGFLGTTDNSPLELRVNNRRAMRYSYAENTEVAADYRSINVLGGSQVNSISAGVVGATIAGGGRDSFTLIDSPNKVTADFGTVSGGLGNTASGYISTMSGGSGNSAANSYATVSGGLNNTASGYLSTVSGGNFNTASGSYATIPGGVYNTASGIASTVSGGDTNIASGSHATVPGGKDNTAAGLNSFAAGYRAKANHTGAFVWADNNNADFASTVVNQFNVRASGGVRIFSNPFFSAGVTLSAGGGSWSSVSDRNAKTNFRDVDGDDVLQRLCAMPLTTWNYKSQDAGIRHIGPMAQDFFAAFHVGEDERKITTIDADGVALAAIQALGRKVRTLEKDNLAIKKEKAELQARLEALETIVAELRNSRHQTTFAERKQKP